jgi:MYXO-CTERM domain-containing protein
VSGEARDGVDNAVDGAADDVPTPGDDTHVHFSCAQGSAGGALPLAALALLLRRRRR